MKNIKFYTVCLVTAIMIFLLGGCTIAPDSSELIVPQTDGCLVSSMRTGTKRQGIVSMQNGFECTADGTYFMCSMGVASWLLYSDHGSDTVIKLCGRPDCNHSDSDCNAYFDSATNICYCDGYLYTFGRSMFSNMSMGLIRINMDGSERLLVYDFSQFMSENGYRGMFSPNIYNGIFTVQFRKLDVDGKEIRESYYYKLDGSMKAPERTTGVALMDVDGDAFITLIGYDADTKQYIYGRWSTNDGAGAELFRIPRLAGADYVGAEARYYIEDGVVYEQSYTMGTKALFDTGLKGNTYQLICFPDCIVISECETKQDLSGGNNEKNFTLHFYDWSFRNLGSVSIDYPLNPVLPAVICGETHERLMLTDSNDLVPRYYINKSDLGTGKIEIHSYKLAGFD